MKQLRSQDDIDPPRIYIHLRCLWEGLLFYIDFKFYLCIYYFLILFYLFSFR